MQNKVKPNKTQSRLSLGAMTKSLTSTLLLIATTIAPITTAPTEAAELSVEPSMEAAILPHIEESTSPDKSATVYATAYKGSAYLYLKRTNKECASHIMTLHHGKVSKILWLSDNSTVLYLGRPFPNGWVHLLSTNIKTHLSRDLTPFADKTARAFYPGDKSNEVFVQIDITDTMPDAIYRIDTTSGALTRAEDAPTTLPSSAVYSPFDLPANKKTQLESTGQIVYADWIKKRPVTPLEGQQQLAKKYQGRIEQFFLLWNPPADNKDFAGYKPWTEEEKTKIKQAISYLATKAPGLVLQAAHGRRICLTRQNKIPGNSFLKSLGKARDSDAANDDGVIILSDHLFTETSNNIAMALTHELTHAADYRQKISMTPEWIKIAGAQVDFLHQLQKLNKAAKLTLIDDAAASYFSLPSSYAACNLSEALAETVSKYVCEDYKPSDPALKFINNQLLREPAAQTDYVAALEESRVYLNNGACTKAIALYSQIIKSHPDFLDARLERADAFVRQGRLREALSDAQTCLSWCQKAGAPVHERVYFWSYMERAYVRYFMGRRKEAVKDLKCAANYAYDNKLVQERLNTWQKELANSRRTKANRTAKCQLSPDQKQGLQLPKTNQEKVKAYISIHYGAGRSAIENHSGMPIISFPCFVERLLWLDDKETVVCLAKQFERSPIHLFSININTEQIRDLTPLAGRNVRAFYYDNIQKDLVVQLNLKDKDTYQLHRINPVTGAIRLDSEASQVLPIQTIYASKIDIQEEKNIAAKRNSTQNHIASHHNCCSIYKPPLPGQLQLEEKYKDRLQQYFYYYQPLPGETLKSLNNTELKSWSNQEKAKFECCIETIANRIPALILHAAHGKRIKLVRVSSMPAVVISDPYKNIAANDAVVADSSIIISDRFFENEHLSKTSIIANLLTRMSDFEGNLSLSKDWIKAVASNVTLLHKATQFKSTNLSSYTKQSLASCYDLPTIDSGISLSEALADSMRAYSCCLYTPKAAAREFIDKTLLPEPNGKPDNGTKLKTAIDLIEAKQYSEAINLLNPIIKNDQQYPLACYHRARAYRLSGRYNLALADIERSLKWLNKAGVPEFDYYQKRSILEKTKIMHSLKDTPKVYAGKQR